MQLVHFFEADCLGAELDSIAISYLGLSSLVLNGERLPDCVGGFGSVILDHIGHTKKAESGGSKLEGPDGSDFPTSFMSASVHVVVHHPALSGPTVFFPLALNVDKRTLPRAEVQVLKG